MSGTTTSAITIDTFICNLRNSVCHGRLLHYLTGLLGSTDRANDVAQDTYLKLYRLISRPSDVHSPESLLRDAATKLAFTHIRRRLRAEAVLTPLDENADGATIDENIELWEPERATSRQQFIEHWSQVVSNLPPSLRVVYVMRYVREITREEIAATLNISVGAVEQRLTRALRYCRENLEKRGFKNGNCV